MPGDHFDPGKDFEGNCRRCGRAPNPARTVACCVVVCACIGSSRSHCPTHGVRPDMSLEMHEYIALERARLAEFERAWERQWSRDVWQASARGEARPTSRATVDEWRARFQSYLRGR